MADTVLYRPPRFIAGLDVGQTQDPSALVVLERQMRLWHGKLEPHYFAGHLERIPLQTPYPVMARGVQERLAPLGEKCALIIDVTGVGRGIVDLFRQAWMQWDRETQQLLPRANMPAIIAVTLTPGERATAERWDEQHVPRRTVLMQFMVCLQQQRFQAAAGMLDPVSKQPMVQTLIKEAQAYRWRRSRDGSTDELYSEWKEAKHDDLLFAVCLAVWYGDKYAPVSVPGTGQTAYATPTGNPLLRRRAIAGRRG